MTAMVGSRGAQMRLANAHQQWAHLKSAAAKGGGNGHQLTPPRGKGPDPGLLHTMVFTPKMSPEQKRGQVGQQLLQNNNQKVQKQRGSPLATPLGSRSPPRVGTEEFYAGAKFSTPPAPTALPKPPSRWTLVMG